MVFINYVNKGDMGKIHCVLVLLVCVCFSEARKPWEKANSNCKVGTSTPGEVLRDTVSNNQTGIFKTINVTNVIAATIESKYISIKLENDYLIFSLTEEFKHYSENEQEILYDSIIKLICETGTEDIRFTIAIIDALNHPPEFIDEPYTFKLAMPLLPHQVTEAEITAKDINMSNNKLIFEAQSDDFEFTPSVRDVNNKKLFTAKLKSKRALDLNNDVTFSITITDVGNPPLKAQSQMTVKVDEKNSKVPNPTFKQALYYGSMDNTPKTIALNQQLELENKIYEGKVNSLQGGLNNEYSSYFRAENTGFSSFIIKQTKEIPSDMMDTLKYVVLVLEVTYDKADSPGRTVILLDIPEQEPPTTTACPTTTEIITTTCPPCTTITEPTTTTTTTTTMSTTTEDITTHACPTTTCPPCTTTVLPETTSPPCTITTPPDTTTCPVTTCEPCECTTASGNTTLSSTTSSGITSETTNSDTTHSTHSSTTSSSDSSSSSTDTTTQKTPSENTCTPCDCTTTKDTTTSDKTTTHTTQSSKPTDGETTHSSSTDSGTTTTTHTTHSTADTGTTTQGDTTSHSTSSTELTTVCPTVCPTTTETTSTSLSTDSTCTPCDCDCTTTTASSSGSTNDGTVCPPVTTQSCPDVSCPICPTVSTTTSTTTRPEHSVRFPKNEMRYEKEAEFVGEIDTIEATSDIHEEIEYSILSVSDEQVKPYLSYNKDGKLIATAAIDTGIYTIVIQAMGKKSNAKDTAKVILSIDSLSKCGEAMLPYSLLVKEVYENEAETALMILGKSDDFELKIIEGENPNNWFMIKNGDLYVKTLDREHPSISDMYVSQIRTTVEIIPKKTTYDQVYSALEYTPLKRDITMENEPWVRTQTIKQNGNRTVVTVIVLDKNDWSPEFQVYKKPLVVGYPSLELAKYIAPPYLVQLHATDKDIGINALIQYSTDDERFIVDPNTGVVIPGKIAFTDDKDTDFTVKATDQNGKGKSDTLSVEVKILEEEHISVLSVDNILISHLDEYLANLSKQVGITVKYLTSAALPKTEKRSKREIPYAEYDDDNGAVLKIVTYALDVQNEPIEVDDFKKLIKENDVDVGIDDYEKPSSSDDNDKDDDDNNLSGWIAAVSTLSVLLALVIIGVLVGYFLYFRPRLFAQETYIKKTSRSSIHVTPVEAKIDKIDASELRRPTGIALGFNADELELDEEEEDEKKEENKVDETDEGIPESDTSSHNGSDRRKSVVKFDNFVTEIEIEKL